VNPPNGETVRDVRSEYRDYDEVVMEKSLASSADGSP